MTKTKKKAAKSAPAPKKGTKLPRKATLKLRKISPDPDKDELERGGELLALRQEGFTQSQVLTMYSNAGINISGPSYYNAIKIAKAPAEVRKAIKAGKITATAVIPLLKLRFTDKQIVDKLNDLIAQREQKAEFMAKSGFGEGNSKLTTNRVVKLVRAKLEKIQKSKALTDARGKAVLAFLNEVENVNDAASLEQLVGGLTGKKAKAKA